MLFKRCVELKKSDLSLKSAFMVSFTALPGYVHLSQWRMGVTRIIIVIIFPCCIATIVHIAVLLCHGH